MESEVLIDVRDEGINVRQLPLIRAFCFMLATLALCGMLLLVTVYTTRAAREIYGDQWISRNCTAVQTAGNWTVCSAVFDCHTVGLGLLNYPSTSWFFCEYVERGSGWKFVVNTWDHRMLWPDDYAPLAIRSEFQFVQGLIVDFVLISIFWCMFTGKCQ
jgi:hypothetical protein